MNLEDKIIYQKNYQKTDFNHSKICQLNKIYKCCKCRKNNYMIDNRPHQICLFCGMPNKNKCILGKTI